MIYTDLALVLANARQHASSRAQLRFLDHVAHMIADVLSEYNKFNKDLFLDKCKTGYDMPNNTEWNH